MRFLLQSILPEQYATLAKEIALMEQQEADFSVLKQLFNNFELIQTASMNVHENQTVETVFDYENEAKILMECFKQLSDYDAISPSKCGLTQSYLKSLNLAEKTFLQLTNDIEMYEEAVKNPKELPNFQFLKSVITRCIAYARSADSYNLYRQIVNHYQSLQRAKQNQSTENYMYLMSE